MDIFTSNYDIIFFGIISVSAIIAFIRGGVVEILSISVWFIAFWVMHKFGNFFDHFIPQSINHHLARSAIIFIISFIIVAIIIAIIRRFLANMIEAIGLGGLNYLIGIAFGVIRGILICALLIIIIRMLNFDNDNAWQKSRLYPVLAPVVNFIVDAIPEKFRELPKPPTANDLIKTS